MANSIAYVVKYKEMLDEVFKIAAITRDLDDSTMAEDMKNAGEVKIPKITTQGLGAYSKTNGFANGDVTYSFETKTLSQRRARSFSIDKVENMDTLDKAFAATGNDFIRTKVIPELDAYRFATIYGNKGAGATGTLDKTTVEAAIDAGILSMDENEVPYEDRFLYVTPTVLKYLENSDGFVRNRIIDQNAGNVSKEIVTYNGMTVVKVPQSRFYTGITLHDGVTAGQEAGGYVKSGTDINFMIVHKPSVMGIIKLEEMRLFAPTSSDAAAFGMAVEGVNQNYLAWKLDFTLYHDLFVLDNKVKGIYAHAKAV